MAALPEKKGAGLLLRCNDEVLLLLRNSRHNNRTWGLPGGNCDAEDASLQETAVREALGELGTLPPLHLAGECLTTRGKRLEKHYTVFVCEVEHAVRASWTPALNAEHVEFRWFFLRWLTLPTPVWPPVLHCREARQPLCIPSLPLLCCSTQALCRRGLGSAERPYTTHRCARLLRRRPAFVRGPEPVRSPPTPAAAAAKEIPAAMQALCRPALSHRTRFSTLPFPATGPNAAAMAASGGI